MNATDIFNEFIRQLIPVAVTFIVALVGLVLNEARRLLVERVGMAQAELIESIVDNAVLAAEQYLKSEDGKARKAFAIATAQRELEARGIRIDVERLGAWIEAAVIVQTKDR